MLGVLWRGESSGALGTLIWVQVEDGRSDTLQFPFPSEHKSGRVSQHLADIFSLTAPFRNRTVLTCCETKVLEQAISTH